MVPDKTIFSDGRYKPIQLPDLAAGVEKADRYNWNKDFGPKATFQYIEKTTLRVDSSYQRNRSINRARRIAREFNWVSFGCATVSERPDGSFWVIDANHRCLAAMMREEIKKVPAIVFHGLTKEQEARSFLEANKNRRQISGLDVWGAEIVSKNPDALKLRRVLVQNGFKVGREEGQVRCIPSILKLMEKEQNVPALEWTIETISKIWPNENLGKTACIIGGMVLFYRKIESLNRIDCLCDASSKFKRHGLDRIYQRALMLAGVSRGERKNSVCDALVEVFNNGCRSGRIDNSLTPKIN